jgi:bifunctional non-homologous end joining protein LigD
MGLQEYQRKRRFDETPEPAGELAKRAGFRFVVQKHQASHLHFDFRLELNGVLLSWAVPKGPSLDPADKRLAMQVEDHPVSYFHFEGTIPDGNYGAGTVEVWDTGTWEPILESKPRTKKEIEQAATAMYEAGDLKFLLHGEKLNGAFVLARMKRGGKKPSWLLIKKTDAHTQSGYDANAPEHDWSVLTQRSLAEIAKQPA